jgi:hypothetical protein
MRFSWPARGTFGLLAPAGSFLEPRDPLWEGAQGFQKKLPNFFRSIHRHATLRNPAPAFHDRWK